MCYYYPEKLNENSIHCKNCWNPDMNKAGHSVHTSKFSVKHKVTACPAEKLLKVWGAATLTQKQFLTEKQRPFKKIETKKFYMKPYVSREFYKRAATWGGSVGELRGEQLFSSTLICSYVRFLTFLSPSKRKQTQQSGQYYFKQETEHSYTHEILTQSLPKLF